MIAGIDHVTRNTKEMLNCTVGKSNLAVFEQILLRNCFEHGQLLKDKTKVSVSEIKSIPQHSLRPYASGALIRIDFHPETAEKIAPPCMARLDLANCSWSGDAPLGCKTEYAALGLPGSTTLLLASFLKALYV